MFGLERGSRYQRTLFRAMGVPADDCVPREQRAALLTLRYGWLVAVGR